MSSKTKCCGADKGNLVLTPVFEAKEDLSWSLSGMQRKFVGTFRAQVRCGACGWTALGTMENAEVDGNTFTAGDFIVDEITNFGTKA